MDKQGGQSGITIQGGQAFDLPRCPYCRMFANYVQIGNDVVIVCGSCGRKSQGRVAVDRGVRPDV